MHLCGVPIEAHLQWGREPGALPVREDENAFLHVKSWKIDKTGAVDSTLSLHNRMHASIFQLELDYDHRSPNKFI